MSTQDAEIVVAAQTVADVSLMPVVPLLLVEDTQVLTRVLQPFPTKRRR
ncbi:hypothetical protein [Rhodopirellula halodulae]|nr:hypothetical protein [Rhodopirellula sp. JC737]